MAFVFVRHNILGDNLGILCALYLLCCIFCFERLCVGFCTYSFLVLRSYYLFFWDNKQKRLKTSYFLYPLKNQEGKAALKSKRRLQGTQKYSIFVSLVGFCMLRYLSLLLLKSKILIRPLFKKYQEDLNQQQFVALLFDFKAARDTRDTRDTRDNSCARLIQKKPRRFEKRSMRTFYLLLRIEH